MLETNRKLPLSRGQFERLILIASLKIVNSSIFSPDHLITALLEESQDLVENNLPMTVRLSNVAQYLVIIELETFQINQDFVFVLQLL